MSDDLNFGRPVKRSLTLRGHRTSVSLEDPFWDSFCIISNELKVPINVLSAQIDASRGVESGLASAIRVYVLQYYINKAQKGLADS
jgi:predicted DNA-binding ribbon-helix-helix protein